MKVLTPSELYPLQVDSVEIIAYIEKALPSFAICTQPTLRLQKLGSTTLPYSIYSLIPILSKV
jgi:hypothetical protein